jgi:hypothetical protein
MVMPAVNVILFGVVPPENKASIISASNIILNLVIAVLSFGIGYLSDRASLRLAFGGAVYLMYFLGILVSLGLLKNFTRDMHRRDAAVETKVATG